MSALDGGKELRKLAHRVLSLGVICGLAACATSYEQCDPDKSGFVRAINCSMSPDYGYEARKRGMEQQVANQQALNNALRQWSATLKQEQLRTSEEKTAKEADYEALDRSWRQLRAAVEQTGVENEALSVQIERMEQQLSAMRRPEVSTQKKQAILDGLKKQAELLNAELKAGLY